MQNDVSQPGQAADDALNDSIIHSLSNSVTGPIWFKHITSRLADSRVLGSGGFATVYRVDITELIDINQSIKYVACKKLSMNAVNDFVRQQFNSEVASMQRILHPHIVRVLGSQCSKESSLIVMELMSGGSISDAVTDNKADEPSAEGIVKPVKLTYEQRFEWIRQLVLGVEALHTAKIAHRDLKAANLLLNADRTTLKIGDFGLAKIKDQTLSVATHKGEASIAVGTRRHMAPELFDPKVRKPDLFASDIYALGGCVEHILTGEMPHPHLREDVLFECARRSPEDLVDTELPDDCPNRAEWSSIIASCRAVRPTQRPTISEVLTIVDGLVAHEVVEGKPHVVDHVLADRLKRLELSESAKKQKAANEEAIKEKRRLVALAEQLAAAKAQVEKERVEQAKARLELEKRAAALAQQQEQERQRQALTRARERAHQAELARLAQEQQELQAEVAARAAALARQQQSQRPAVSHSYSGAYGGGYSSQSPSQGASQSFVTPPRHSGVATGEHYRSNGSADGRPIYRGPQGGMYTLTASGNKSYIR